MLPRPLLFNESMKELINRVKGMFAPKVQTKALPNETLVNTRKLSPAKRKAIKSEATTPVKRGRKPTTKKK
jgi:hypothetical protein